jgi:uncharacterized protein
MKRVFVDTSGFYALLVQSDPYHSVSLAQFEAAQKNSWELMTTNYVIHETWSLVQNRLGWDALDDLLDTVLPLCHVEAVDSFLHALGVARCRQARERRLSLTDCVSFEYCKHHGITEAIAFDEHFEKQKLKLPR